MSFFSWPGAGLCVCLCVSVCVCVCVCFFLFGGLGPASFMKHMLIVPLIHRCCCSSGDALSEDSIKKDSVDEKRRREWMLTLTQLLCRGTNFDSTPVRRGPLLLINSGIMRSRDAIDISGVCVCVRE